MAEFDSIIINASGTSLIDWSKMSPKQVRKLNKRLSRMPNTLQLKSCDARWKRAVLRLAYRLPKRPRRFIVKKVMSTVTWPSVSVKVTAADLRIVDTSSATERAQGEHHE